MNKPQQVDQTGVVVPIVQQNNQLGTPLVKIYLVKVYTGQELHSSINAFSETQAQDIANYYTQRGYTTEIVEA